MHTVFGLLILVVGIFGVAYYTVSSKKALDYVMEATVPPALPPASPLPVPNEGETRADRKGMAVTTSAPPRGEWRTEVVHVKTPTGSLMTAESRSGSETRVAQDDLIPKLQRELKRVGCYSGSIDGVWNAEAKRAMAAFMDRVNSTLSTDRPDEILLRMVQNHAAQVCGATCPRGEVLVDDGRCQPHATIVRNGRRSTDKSASAETAAGAKASGTTRTAKSWTTTVKPETPLTPTVIVENDAAGRRLPPAALDGRMAVGAPVARGPAPAPEPRGARVAAAPETPIAPPLAAPAPPAPVVTEPPVKPPLQKQHSKPGKHTQPQIRKTAPPPRTVARAPTARYAPTSGAPRSSGSSGKGWARSILDNTARSGR